MPKDMAKTIRESPKCWRLQHVIFSGIVQNYKIWLCYISSLPIDIKIEIIFHNTALKVPVFGVFLVRIFAQLDLMGRDREYLSVFSPNAEKHGPEKLRLRTLFKQCNIVCGGLNFPGSYQEKKLFLWYLIEKLLTIAFIIQRTSMSMKSNGTKVYSILLGTLSALF